MSDGSRLPRYACLRCRRKWARGGPTRTCPHCGQRHDVVMAELVGYGFDGLIRKMTRLGAPTEGRG